MKILAKTFRFDKGQLQVILLPEEPQYCNLTIQDQCEEYNVWLETLSRYGCKCRALEIAYNEAVAYARAHPVDVKPEDVNKIKRKLWCFLPMEHDILLSDWKPTDLTEYKLDGVRMEIKTDNYPCPESSCKYEVDLECYCSKRGNKQVACLIEDDKN